MKHLLLTILTFSCITISAQLPKNVYNEDLNQMEQIDAAVKDAKETGRRVICQVGGNWCIWCLRFADFITKDEEIASFIKDNYVYIHVAYAGSKSKDSEVAEQMMKRLGNPGRFGYPVMVVLDADGKVVHTQDSSFLEEGQGYNKDKVMRFLKCWTGK